MENKILGFIIFFVGLLLGIELLSISCGLNNYKNLYLIKNNQIKKVKCNYLNEDDDFIYCKTKNKRILYNKRFILKIEDIKN